MLNKEEALLKLEDLKQAVTIEKARRYIDVQGKRKSFSRFVYDTLKDFQFLYPPQSPTKTSVGGKTDETNDTELGKLLNRFRQYRFMDLNARMHTLETVEQFLKTFSLQETPHSRTTQASVPAQNVLGKEIKALDQIEVQYLKGVGPKFAQVLAQVGIHTVEDLLYYFPRRYLDYQNRLNISELQEGKEVTVLGQIRSSSAYQPQGKRMTIVSVGIGDGTGTVYANWFLAKSSKAQAESFKSRYVKGADVLISGKVKWDRFKKAFAIDRPELEILSYAANDPNDEATGGSIHAGRIVPVYPLCEGLNLRTLRKAIHNALQDYLPTIADPLPEDIRRQYRMIPLDEALRQIHFPDTQQAAEAARTRLVFDELFYLQVRLALLRQQYKRHAKAFSFMRKTDSYSDHFIANLPFTLTNAQKRSLEEICADLASTQPMYRLLQGDVGCGKTVVAALTLLIAVENGFQGALMVPTEILAEQHYRKFVEWLTPLGLKTALVLGKAGAKERREVRQGLASGQIHVAIGTHALIQEDVEFSKLGIIVIDEQHRFGVRQRTLLKNKGEHPEMLTMTATPIPRTLAMTTHGDLDVSIIDERPPGRTPIKTVLLSGSQRAQSNQLIRYEVGQGRQAYVVFPLIEESEAFSAKAATTETERLAKEVFPDLSVGLLHGKMRPEEKEAVMADFIKKKLHILVSTTVIEVGVDVPNATVMVIENADRFGLAQLHQLRGRVGRGAHQSYCVLMSDSRGAETMERLGIMTQTEDGFEIAERDLALRGPGEFLGTRQSGLPELMLADLVMDKAILEEARQCAFKVVESPDYLQQHPQLERMIFQKTETSMEVLGSG
ncbi:MAG: ATP-dependent DNA helicase RecG [Vampirovibrionales bacterium]|nr:ATP-dependent DNA helicase RecG [Vampirovibrionales bacterium]